MIFVTVGTHEQQFNRLIKEIDCLVEKGVIQEEVFAQIGYSTYEPINYKWSKLISYEEMDKYIKQARIVVTHGGPASFLAPLQVGKIPIVVPRHENYDEHVNNHQLEFAKKVSDRNNNIIVVEDIKELETAILDYNEIIAKMQGTSESNTKIFNDKLQSIINDMFDKKKE